MSSSLQTGIDGTGRYFASYQMGMVNSNLAKKPLIYNGDIPNICTIAVVAQSLWDESANM